MPRIKNGSLFLKITHSICVYGFRRTSASKAICAYSFLITTVILHYPRRTNVRYCGAPSLLLVRADIVWILLQTPLQQPPPNLHFKVTEKSHNVATPTARPRRVKAVENAKAAKLATLCCWLRCAVRGVNCFRDLETCSLVTADIVLYSLRSFVSLQQITERSGRIISTPWVEVSARRQYTVRNCGPPQCFQENAGTIP